MTTYFLNQPMDWINQTIHYVANESNTNTFKSQWKIVLNKSEKENYKCRNIFGYILSPYGLSIGVDKLDKRMSYIKLLAINTLEFSAPASPILLQQHQKNISFGWLQLAGHPESIAPSANGTVRKRISSDNDLEAIAYRRINSDVYASKIVPRFLGVREENGETYLELQDLLQGFDDPAVMDIKMGRRTFLESEVSNFKLRNDLYEKMITVAPNEPNEEEHKQQAITKLRYMLFRERMSSSSCKGFRIEALRMKGLPPVTDLKTIKSNEEVYETISKFLGNRKKHTKELIGRLKEIRNYIEKSVFFKRHEIVGSSIFIVYDDNHVGAWLIDFAKSRQLNENVQVDHRRAWVPGNSEEGLLYGLDELIKVFNEVLSQRTLKFNQHIRRKYSQLVK